MAREDRVERREAAGGNSLAHPSCSREKGQAGGRRFLPQFPSPLPLVLGADALEHRAQIDIGTLGNEAADHPRDL